jgi:hypothetical protein
MTKEPQVTFDVSGLAEFVGPDGRRLFRVTRPRVGVAAVDP